MNSLTRLSIRTQIIALIILMTLIPTAIIVYTAHKQEQHDIAEAVEMTAAVAERVAADQKSLLASAEQLVAIVSVLPDVKARNAPAVNKLLAELVASHPLFTNIVIADRSGSLWASATPFSGRVSIADRRHFRNTLKRGKAASGEYVIGRIKNSAVMGFAYPVTNSAGDITDVMVVSFSLETYSSLYSGHIASPISSVLLTDHNGTILYSSVDSSLNGKQDRADLFKRMSEGGDEGTFEAKGNLGIERIFSYRKIWLNGETTPYMYIRTGLDKKYVIAKARKDMLLGIGTLMPAMFVMLGLAIWFCRRGILDKIRALQDDTLRIANGEPPARVHEVVSRNELDGLGGAFNDMARRLQQADEARLKSEQRFRSFIENVNDVIFALNTAGEFIYVSPNWTEAFGYDVSETIGRPFVPFVHPEDVSACSEFMQLVFETGHKQSGVEYRVKRKDGSYLWYRANASPMLDPITNSLSLLGIGRDITEMKQAQDVLRQTEERFSAAFHASPDAISLSRLGNGTFLDVNEGFTVLTGYRREEAIGKSAIELNLWESQLDRVQLLLELRESGMVTGKELHFRRKDGSRRVGQMAARSIEIDNEPYLLAIIRDVTEHEQLQKELIKAQKLESISVLAGGIAHNFNNVLTGVIGYISYAKKHLGEADKALQTLEAAEKASYRAAGIARQLLAFSRSGVPVRMPVKLDELIKESVALFLSGSKVKGIVDCPPHQTISVDSQQISQAFNNIVLNALQAMPEGGTLKVTSENLWLRGSNRFKLPAGHYVRIDFRDTGCGIVPEDLDKVYDPYFTTKESGTGLGLSTCHTIVTKHGGYIGITSKPGQGTCVTVLLPAADEQREETDGGTAGNPVSGGSVLVMDDDESIRKLAVDILGGLGYAVTPCSRGEEACRLYEESAKAGRSFSLVILDLSVPDGMGGIEAARRILGFDPQARLIASSGYSNDPAIADFRAFGFCGAVAKPYSMDELAGAIRKALAAPKTG